MLSSLARPQDLLLAGVQGHTPRQNFPGVSLLYHRSPTQTSEGCHLLSIRGWNNPPCAWMSVCPLQMVARPTMCVLRRSMKLATCMATVVKICLGNTGAVRTGEVHITHIALGQL